MKFKSQANPAELHTLNSECLIVPVFTDKPLNKAVRMLDSKLSTIIADVLKRGDASAKTGQFLLIPVARNKHCKIQRIALLGCGEYKQSDDTSFRKAITGLYGKLSTLNIKTIHFLFTDIVNKKFSPQIASQSLATIFESESYKYDTTLTHKASKPTLQQLVTLLEDTRGINTQLAIGKAVGNGLNTAKQLGNLPANICTPRYLAAQATALARKHKNLHTKILEEKQMETLGMGSLLSVSRGSKEPARLISMDYRGGKTSEAPLVLVGKGITFDTGGISLKPGAAMDEMKFDMCGAASVFGVMAALAQINAKLNVIGVVAAAENMPSSQATKPGDVVTSMSGKTIEILNTDAEGRLVLCDALTYVERFKPRAVIDIATLTGAAIVALGHHASGLFSNNDQLADKLLTAGEASGDRAWRLPIWAPYHEQLKSNFADLANIGGKAAGSITAACFLSQFAENYPWAHLDIAGTAWNSGKSKGATGKPVELLTRYLLNEALK